MSYIKGKISPRPENKRNGKSRKSRKDAARYSRYALWSKPPLYYPTKIQKNIEKAKCFPDYF